MKFIPLGYGTESDALEKIEENGDYILIRDDDAAVVGASDCWFAVPDENVENVENQYEQSGGTVSAIISVRIHGINNKSKYPKLLRVIDLG